MITNNNKIPVNFVKAVERDFHRGGDYSASMLSHSVRQVHLEKRHKHEVIEDVTERIWSLLGTAMHKVLEMGESENQLVEHYMSSKFGEVEFTGCSDLYEGGVISDYKLTTVYSYIYLKDKIEDFTCQLNSYSLLFQDHGYPVNKLQIVMVFRDWNKNQVKGNYPDSPVKIIDIDLWSYDKSEGYIEGRINLFEKFKNVDSKNLPFCTPIERWAKPPTFAVKKGEKAKRADRVFETIEEAQNHAKIKGQGFIVETRLGDMFKKCPYCSGRQFCNQYAERYNPAIEGE